MRKASCVFSKPVGLLLLLVVLVVGGRAQAAHFDFDARDATVTALLEAGLRLDSDHASNRAFELIREVQAEAVAAYRNGDTEVGYERLDQAYVLVQTVVRRLASDPDLGTRFAQPANLNVIPQDSRTDRYESLRHSVTALQAAYRAIRDEVQDTDADQTSRVVTWVTAAEAERNADQMDAALRKLKMAYVLLQGEIVRLRGGQTLVRELRFTSAAEEYAYEVDRHDSHLLLVELLLGSARGNPVWEAEIEASVDESMRLHWIAHKHAAAGDYRKAVAWLELASDGLVALIRAQGFDIPRQ
ncbi:MAG: hypothetical protein GWP66_10145 [Gammaproteobacteria bacterium]|jgi:hypothetical protein|nr:hypothetical protein [Gammaproteobacteria bacterium]